MKRLTEKEARRLFGEYIPAADIEEYLKENMSMMVSPRNAIEDANEVLAWGVGDIVITPVVISRLSNKGEMISRKLAKRIGKPDYWFYKKGFEAIRPVIFDVHEHSFIDIDDTKCVKRYLVNNDVAALTIPEIAGGAVAAFKNGVVYKLCEAWWVDKAYVIFLGRNQAMIHRGDIADVGAIKAAAERTDFFMGRKESEVLTRQVYLYTRAHGFEVVG